MHCVKCFLRDQHSKCLSNPFLQYHIISLNRRQTKQYLSQYPCIHHRTYSFLRSAIYNHQIYRSVFTHLLLVISFSDNFYHKQLSVESKFSAHRIFVSSAAMHDVLLHLQSPPHWHQHATSSTYHAHAHPTNFSGDALSNMFAMNGGGSLSLSLSTG